MARFTRSTTIAAPPPTVWPALANIGAVGAWNPMVEKSWRTSERMYGMGAERHCDLAGGNAVDERVVEWEPESALTMEIIHTDLPFARGQVRFTLRPVPPGTEVDVTPDYTLKYGLIGRALDALAVKPKYVRAMDALLEGLKRHVEAGDAEPSTPET